MNLEDWDATIQQIVDEINQVPTDSQMHKVLIAWRIKLEQEPTSLEPFQIDKIVRAVRKRISR